MSKYNYTANEAEDLINRIGGMEGLQKIKSREYKIEVNTVHRQLNEICHRYGNKLRNAGAIILNDKSSGTRDILLPFTSRGSQRKIYSDFERAILSRGIQLNETDFLTYPLDTVRMKEQTTCVSLRNTMERAIDKELSYHLAIPGLSCVGLFGFMTHYFDVFEEDWFSGEPLILPLGYVSHYALGGNWLFEPDRLSTEPSVLFLNIDPSKYCIGPWLTV